MLNDIRLNIVLPLYFFATVNRSAATAEWKQSHGLSMQEYVFRWGDKHWINLIAAYVDKKF